MNAGQSYTASRDGRVRVEFASNHLRRCYERYHEAVRTWGPDIAARYTERVNILLDAESFNSLFSVRALRMHPLRGQREGEYAIVLTGRARLIVTVSEDRET